MTLRIDAHLHVWDRSRAEYPWLLGAPAELARDHPLEEARPALRRAGVAGAVLVQSSDTAEDSEYLLEVARAASDVLGVVAWAPLEDPRLAARVLRRYSASSLVVGVRSLTHDYADADWLLQPAVLRSLELVRGAGLTLDVVAVLPRHLEVVIEIADRVPGLPIVLDHLAHPPFHGPGWERWATSLREAAQRPAVSAKISGLYPPADGAERALRRAVSVAIETFGAARLMVGGDWPVCGDARRLHEWHRTVDRLLLELPSAERARVLSGTAVDVYSLSMRSGALHANASDD